MHTWYHIYAPRYQVSYAIHQQKQLGPGIKIWMFIIFIQTWYQLPGTRYDTPYVHHNGYQVWTVKNKSGRKKAKQKHRTSLAYLVSHIRSQVPGIIRHTTTKAAGTRYKNMNVHHIHTNKIPAPRNQVWYAIRTPQWVRRITITITITYSNLSITRPVILEESIAGSPPVQIVWQRL